MANLIITLQKLTFINDKLKIINIINRMLNNDFIDEDYVRMLLIVLTYNY